MRRDGVEVKVNLAVAPIADGVVGAPADEDDLPEVVKTLELRDPRHWWIWFYEEPATDETAFPLLEDRVVVRVRARLDDGGLDKAACTVKLRPCERDQLTDHWAEARATDDLDYSIEEDWSGDRHVLAVSASVEVPSATATWLATVPRMAPGLIRGDQAKFLVDCAPRRVDASALHRLGPIAAVRWETAQAGALAGLGARAELWTVGDLRFLEVSVKVDDADDAPGVQASLDAALDALGVTVDPDDDPKTRRVLTALASFR